MKKIKGKCTVGFVLISAAKGFTRIAMMKKMTNMLQLRPVLETLESIDREIS